MSAAVAGFSRGGGVATAKAAAARVTTSAAAAAVELAVAARRRRRRRRRAGGEGHQREAETPQHRSLSETRYAAGPDTRNRTSNPDSWVLPGRTTIGREKSRPRARPRHPIGSQGKLRPSGQPREGGQTVARGRGGTLLTR